MIKLFAWQSYTLEKIEMTREPELQLVRRVRLMESVMQFSNDVIPIVAKLVVFAVYVRCTFCPDISLLRVCS
jgi:hypothetical protein